MCVIAIVHSRLEPALNLGLEEALFRAPGAETRLLLWRNGPCVVVGRHQNAWAEANLEFLQARGVSLLRRISGGGAVWHDPGNLNYSLIQPRTEGDAALDWSALDPVLAALRRLGLPAKFGPRHELLAGGGKISGTAQHVSRGRRLVHGTLLYRADLAALDQALHPAVTDTFSTRAAASVRSRVVNLAELLPAPAPEPEAFAERLLAALAEDGEVTERREPTGAEWVEAERLAAERYRVWDWNFAHSPPACRRRRLTMPEGAATSELEIRDGRIAAVSLLELPGLSPVATDRIRDRLVGCRLADEPLDACLQTAAAAESLPPELAARLRALLRP